VLQCVAQIRGTVHMATGGYVLQRVAACCSVLQRVAACCNVVQCNAVRVTGCCSALQCVAVRCSVL